MAAHSSDFQPPGHGELEGQRAQYRALLQDYVDGTLDDKAALRLHLFAERDDVIASELAAMREFFAGLDAARTEEPSPGFDDRVLAAIPYEKYATAPRLPERVLVVGDDSVPLPVRLLAPLRHGLTAVAAGYVLFLAVSHSALRDGAVGLARWTGAGLSSLAARTQEVPVLSDVVGFVARTYDAGTSWLASVATTTGEGILTFVLGLALGAMVLGFHLGVRRRGDARRPEL